MVNGKSVLHTGFTTYHSCDWHKLFNDATNEKEIFKVLRFYQTKSKKNNEVHFWARMRHISVTAVKIPI